MAKKKITRKGRVSGHQTASTQRSLKVARRQIKASTSRPHRAEAPGSKRKPRGYAGFKRTTQGSVKGASTPKSKVAKRAKAAVSVRPRSKFEPTKRTRPKKLVRKPSRPIQRPPIRIDRNERTAIKGAVALIRKHVKGYEAKDGYGLVDVVRFTKSRQRTLLTKATKIRELLASPHDLVKVKNERDKKALRPFARKQLRRARHYIVHKPDDGSQVRLQKGRVRITRKLGRVEIDSIYFMFPHAPRGEDDAVEMIEDMLPDMPRGYYIMQTGAHGDTGEPVHRDAILRQLSEYMNAYQKTQASIEVFNEQGEVEWSGTKVIDSGFTESIRGYRFISTTLDGAVVEQRQTDVRRAAAKEFNEKLRKQHLTQAEKDEAKSLWRAKRARRKRKQSAKKGAATKRANAKSAVHAVARKKKATRKK